MNIIADSYYTRYARVTVTLLFLLGVSLPYICSAQETDSSVAVTMISDESDAVLAILARKSSGEAVTRSDWQHLFSSEGYVRLKKREASMHRDFTDDQFKAFVLSDSLFGRFQNLRTTLGQWKKANVAGAARRALAYLPRGAGIKTKIYPVIKPKTNSFVFEVSTDPAIFLYLDPEVSRDEFENTLAHELHHIGYAYGCAGQADRISEDSTISEGSRTVLQWVGAFGEGFAMLAAAGGPDIHPHATGKLNDRARWDNDMKNFNSDLKKVERFFLDILENKLAPEEIRNTAFSFYGIQGPWYTVGWKMAATIEKTYGRAKLIECMCDLRELLPVYNRAASESNRTNHDSLAVWSPLLIEHIRK